MANSPLPCTLLTAVGCQELSSGNIYNLLSTLLYIKLATTSIRLLNGTNVTWQTFGLVSLSRCNIEVFHQRTHCSFSVCNPYSCYCHCDPTSAPHPVPIQFLPQVYGLLQTVYTRVQNGLKTFVEAFQGIDATRMDQMDAAFVISVTLLVCILSFK